MARVIPLGERHLRQILHEYVDHYHTERNHQGLHNKLVTSTADDVPAANGGRVLRRRRLGGVLNYYHRDAARVRSTFGTPRRWQIELQFKRWKSLCGFDRMPNFRADTIASWLYAKILSAVLLERLASLHSEVFPPIDCEDDEELDADGEAALEVDPVAVAAARFRAIADEALRAASARRAYH